MYIVVDQRPPVTEDYIATFAVEGFPAELSRSMLK